MFPIAGTDLVEIPPRSPSEAGGPLNHIRPGTEYMVMEGIPHYFSNITSSGGGTYSGHHNPAFEFAQIEDTLTGKKMKWYAQVSSGPGFIYRSVVGWGGDFIPGLRVKAWMLSRRNVEKPSSSGIAGKSETVDQVTAAIAFALPDQPGQTLVFVGYGSDAGLCEVFGLNSLCLYLNDLQKRRTVP